MKNRLLYISVLAAAVLSSCAKEQLGEQTLSGTGEKTPLEVVSNLSIPTPVTRAVDGKFEADELLNAYIKHVTVSNPAANPLVWAADVTGTGVGPRLANFKVTALTTDHENDADNWTNHSATSTLAVTDAQGLYWDDFSNSVDADHDLRTSGHALMVYYGYGYNGGTATTALTESTGVLGWTVATDQTSGFKNSDLLYAGQQTPVAYAHGSNNTITGRDRVLTVPYTHAMSKVTIEVVCDEGFDEDAAKNFGSAAVKLYQAGTAATVTGPTKAVGKGTSPADINMQKLTPVQAKQCSFSALMAPTLVKAGETFATISGIDGNNYTITLTDAAIDEKVGDETKTTAWSTQLAAYDAASVTPDAVKAYTQADGGLTKPGVHYMLTVTIKKQQIKVEATIREWDAVSATGAGVIQFANDVTDKTGDIADGLKTNGFDIYKSETTTFGTKATTVSWIEDESKWEYDPVIYWANGSDNSFFRALSGAVSDDSGTAENESLEMSQGRDVLWGTTAAHSGTDAEGTAYNYDRGAIIRPRTGNVPLEFEHPMSKITVNLETVTGDSAVTLAGAKISIANIYDNGTIDLNNGSIGNLEASAAIPINDYLAANDETSGNKLKDFVVIPQSLTKLKDGATLREGAIAIYPETNVLYESFLTDPATTAKTSIGTGTPAYYLISQLTSVPATLFTDADTGIINTHNAALPGAVSESTVKEPARLYTLEEFNTANIHKTFTEEQFKSIPDEGKIKEEARPYTLAEFQVLDLTEDQFNALPAELKVKTAAVLYTEQTASEANRQHMIADGNGKQPGEDGYVITYDHGYKPVNVGDVQTPATYYNFADYPDHKVNAAITQDQFDALSSELKTKPEVLYSYSEYKALTSITQTMFDYLPVELKTKDAVNYTQSEANTYNAALDGAWHVNDVKVPAYYKLTDSEAHSLANDDLKTAGNKIMMYITLADGTRYVIDLATCKDSSDNVIDAWQRGKHYTYTISLAKEQITFRAMIKAWEEKTGSGNATLEWDD